MSLLQPIPHRRTVRIIMWEILTERNPVLRPKMEEIQDTVIRASSITVAFRMNQIKKEVGWE